jgi:hypothetical protein
MIMKQTGLDVGWLYAALDLLDIGNETALIFYFTHLFREITYCENK